MSPHTISLNLLVDNSRFMHRHVGRAEELLCTILDEYRQYPTTVSCSVFSDSCFTDFTDKLPHELPPLSIEPAGESTLFESACKLIDEIGKRLAAMPEDKRPQKVVFVLLTAGQDSVSDLAFSKELLQDKIGHQSDVYSWQFVFPLVDFQQFHPTVVRIREPIKKTTFQFSANLIVPCGKTSESVFEEAIDCVHEWISLKLGPSTPDRQQFAENFEFDRFILPSLKIATIPGEGRWCSRMVHADEPGFNRPAIAGLTWTSDIALHRTTETVHFALRIFATAAFNMESILPIRPRLITDIGRQIGFEEDGVPLKFERWAVLNNESDIVYLTDSVRSFVRQIPIVLIATENDDVFLPTFIFEKQVLPLQQSIAYFGYVVVLPEHLWEYWTQKIGDDLSVPKNGVRIYYPITKNDSNTHIDHPSYTQKDIDSWRWSSLHGEVGFAAFLKETLTEHAAIKSIDWGSNLFYPRVQSRLMELRREQLAKLPDKEYVELLEEDNKALVLLKRELEEKDCENRTLKHRVHELNVRLDHQYRPQQPETKEPISCTKISSHAMGQLKKIHGKQWDKIAEMIDGVSNELWRETHSHDSSKTDLLVYKLGQDNPAWIIGFFREGDFHVSHVFSMQHGDYERTLNKSQQRDVEGWEYTLWKR